MADLEYRPDHLLLLLALVRGVLRILHLVRKLQQRVFDIVEAIRRRLAVAGGANRGHFQDDVQGRRSVEVSLVAFDRSPSPIRNFLKLSSS